MRTPISRPTINRPQVRRAQVHRPQKQRPKVQRQQVAVSVAPRPERTSPVLRRIALPVVARPAANHVAPAVINFAPNPYVDYSRVLTPEGGVLITYKDIDTRFIYTLRRLFLWSGATGGEAWYLFHASPVANVWINIACLLVVAIINWLIVKRPVEIFSRIEIRPDGMIIDGRDIFWLRNMEKGFPSFHPDSEGNSQLSGIYGTRQVDYLTVRRFDPLDRTPEVLAGHLQDAMRQLWTRHY